MTEPISKAASGQGTTRVSRLELKVRDKPGEEPVVEQRIEGDTTILYVRRPDDCLQIVVRQRRIVHLDCKADGCGNDWKAERGEPRDGQFRVDHSNDMTVVECLNCGREYFVAKRSAGTPIDSMW